MLRNITAALIVLLISSPTHAATVANLSSGIDGAGSGIAEGTADDTWALIAAPSGIAFGPALVVPPARGAYVQFAPNAYWLSPSAATNVDAPGGLYTYRATFDLTGFVDPVLSGQFAADNRVIDIVLNGQTFYEGRNKGTPCTAANLLVVCVDFDTGYPFSTSNPTLFLPGTNVLDFIVENESITGGNPTAVLIQANVTGNPVPLPAAALLLGSALGVLGWMRRRVR